MRVVKRFQCDFCKKVLSKKSDMEKHEERCPRNPATKSCGTCSHLRHTSDAHGFDTVYCEMAAFSAENRTDRNPLGLRSMCPCYARDQYRFN